MLLSNKYLPSTYTLIVVDSGDTVVNKYISIIILNASENTILDSQNIHSINLIKCLLCTRQYRTYWGPKGE